MPGHTSHPILSAESYVAVELLSCVQLLVTPGLQHTRLLCPPLSPEVCSSSRAHMSQWCSPTILFILCHPFCLQSFQHLVFPTESALHVRWPKYRSFSMGPSNEYSRLLSCRIDWFDQCGRVLHLRMWIFQYGTHWSLASSFQCCFESSGIIYILTLCMWCFPLLPSLYHAICRTWFFSLLFWNNMYKVLFSCLILGTWVTFSINKLAFSSGKFPYIILFIISFPLLSLLSFPGISVFQSWHTV